MSNNTGGPAFPQNTKIVHAAGQEVHQGFMGGMTLRDYFAAKAMQECVGAVSPEVGTRLAYEWADAMLKAREESK